ncbi:MAG: zinc ribbon domain-containing protein, partial [Thermoplasmata archaeon]|nr:zinc ribbon domain-containing protein [Thermoplasmata archaeon]
GESQDLEIKVYNHTFGGYNEDDVVVFLNQTAGLDPEKIRFNWTVIRNTTMTMTFYTSAQINNIWAPLREGIVKIYLLETPDPTPNRPAEDWEKNDLNWTVIPDSDGVGNLTIRVPDALGVYQLYIAISGGPFDPTFEPITYRFLDIVVKPPQTIQIISARIQEYPIRVGDAITVQGSVRYIYTDLPVLLAEITVEGSHVSPGLGLTDSEGRFTINMQAPLMPQDNISMEIIAVDPSSEERSAIIIDYSVEPPEDEITEDVFPWGWVMVGIIAAVIAFAIALGAVMMYRKHYGEVVECGECGAFISASSTMCPKCGIEFETDLARCSECEAWIPANSTSCPVCATAFTIQSLEEQVAQEEADEDLAPIDQVTT